MGSSKIRILLFLVLFSSFTHLLCSFPKVNNKVDGDKETSILHNGELTQEQQSALDAFDRLQLGTDRMNRCYSTFPNQVQPCYPPDSTFLISQSDFRLFMEKFVTINCQNLTPEYRDQLVETSILAQSEYKIAHCRNENVSLDHSPNSIPIQGTWILINVLDRRDIVFVW